MGDYASDYIEGCIAQVISNQNVMREIFEAEHGGKSPNQVLREIKQKELKELESGETKRSTRRKVIEE